MATAVVSWIVPVLLHFFFFFFQAEDGIRDRTVTGVQTCDLPISDVVAALVTLHRRLAAGRQARGWTAERRGAHAARDVADVRSEERRVGKECRSRGARDHGKKKE